ncbi:hypothetical protein ACNKHS_12430 [Shigella flexneri]
MVVIINFPVLLGLMVVASNFVPLVFGENGTASCRSCTCCASWGLLRRWGTRLVLCRWRKRAWISDFKFNVFKTFLFIPQLLWAATRRAPHWRDARLPAGGGIVNTVVSYFVMIKPVLGSTTVSTS